MQNPAIFTDPEKFVPDRFIKNGEFVNDVRVCVFSLGLRNCVGKQLAISEYFIFAADKCVPNGAAELEGSADVRGAVRGRARHGAQVPRTRTYAAHIIFPLAFFLGTFFVLVALLDGFLP